MTDARVIRNVAGVRYELIIHYVDAGGDAWIHYLPSTWELLRDGQPVMDGSEAHLLRHQVFDIGEP